MRTISPAGQLCNFFINRFISSKIFASPISLLTLKMLKRHLPSSCKAWQHRFFILFFATSFEIIQLRLSKSPLLKLQPEIVLRRNLPTLLYNRKRLRIRAFHTRIKSFKFSKFEIAAKIDPKRRTKLESERAAHTLATQDAMSLIFDTLHQ